MSHLETTKWCQGMYVSYKYRTLGMWGKKTGSLIEDPLHLLYTYPSSSILERQIRLTAYENSSLTILTCSGPTSEFLLKFHFGNYSLYGFRQTL